MVEYGFKKVEPDNPESNLYTSNWYGGKTEGIFYKKEDVAYTFAKFVLTFLPIEKSIKEMKSFLSEEFKTEL